MYLSSVSLAELLLGIRVTAGGQAQEQLDRALTELLELFKDRVLPFDTDAVRHHADLAVTARNGGLGFPTPDGYIAAVAASRRFIVASRDASPYEAAASVTVINPWKDVWQRCDRRAARPGARQTERVIPPSMRMFCPVM